MTEIISFFCSSKHKVIQPRLYILNRTTIFRKKYLSLPFNGKLGFSKPFFQSFLFKVLFLANDCLPSFHRLQHHCWNTVLVNGCGSLAVQQKVMYVRWLAELKCVIRVQCLARQRYNILSANLGIYKRLILYQ